MVSSNVIHGFYINKIFVGQKFNSIKVCTFDILSVKFFQFYRFAITNLFFIVELNIQSISQRHDESGDANMRKLDLSMKYFRSQDQIVLMRKSKIHIKQILSD